MATLELLSYVQALAKSAPEGRLPRSMDLVLDIGGLDCIRTCGVLLYITQLMHERSVVVSRVSCTGSNAALGVLFLLGRMAGKEQPDLPAILSRVGKSLEHHRSLAPVTELVLATLKNANNPSSKETVSMLGCLQDRLFITYHDTKKPQVTTVSRYRSVSHLCRILKRATHVPYLENDSLVYKRRYFTGLSPFVFTDRARTCLLVSPSMFLNGLSAVSSRGERTYCPRLLEGVSDVHDHFAGGISKWCWELHGECRFTRLLMIWRDMMSLGIIVVASIVREGRCSKISQSVVSGIGKKICVLIGCCLEILCCTFRPYRSDRTGLR